MVEREPGGSSGDDVVLTELKALAGKAPVTAGLDQFRIFPGTFPVDTRHNAKIEREKLARWAAEE